VVAAIIHQHIGFRGHVAVDALRARAALPVMMVLHGIEFRRHMALRAERIALRAERQTVRLMAIGAGDAGMIHSALDERPIFEHLAVDLPIGTIEAGHKQRGQVGIDESRTHGRILGDHLAAGMASGAHVELLRLQWLNTLGNARLGIQWSAQDAW
jgi:hypothetical protein